MSLMGFITRTRRYHPEDHELDHSLHFTSSIWVVNIFRAWEWLFGRAEGIRIESSSTKDAITVYTLEALLVLIEVTIREFFSSKLLPLKLVTLVPNPNYSDKPIRIPGVMFAIAWDAKAVGVNTTTSPITWAHTCTGSNMLLVVQGANKGTGTSTITAPTYNGTTMAIASSQQVFNSLHNITALYYLINPTTGANTVSMAFGGTAASCNGASSSYSGVQQSGQPDATNSVTGTAANVSIAVTTVADNCWVVGAFASQNTSATTAGQTLRESFSYGPTSVVMANLQDTNGVVHPAGSQTMSWTNGSAAYALVGASFAPVVAGVVNSGLLSFC